MLPLWTALLRASLPTDILAGMFDPTLCAVAAVIEETDVSYALYGLGDSSYERFCYAGKMLARRLEGLGAEALAEPMWGDERAPDGYVNVLSRICGR